MDQEFDLELTIGSQVKLRLPEPGDFESLYVFSMEYSGIVPFWQLLGQLLDAVGRPVLAFQEVLRQNGLNQEDVTPSALHGLLSRRGYVFGFFLDVDSALPEYIVAERPKLLFLRNPRDVFTAVYSDLLRSARFACGSETQASATRAIPTPASFAEFLKSSIVEKLAWRYRRLADLWRRQRHAIVFRYEHALSGWHSIASDIAVTLKLPLDPTSVASIAVAAPHVADRMPAAEGLTVTEISDLEMRIADVMTAFGYAPHNYSPVRATKDSGKQQSRFGAMVENDPILHTRLKANALVDMNVLGRRVVMDVDATGCRPVIGQRDAGEKTFAAYGCSFTYGVAIAADETFCSLLQGLFPTWRFENHGVGGYSTVQNLIQLERNCRWRKPEFVTFCWIADHLGRNVASIPWIQAISGNIPRPITGESPQRSFPRAALDASGELQMRSVRVPRHDILGIDVTDFRPDPYYLDLVCFRLLERADSIVTGYGGHFFVTTLQGSFSAHLTGRLAERGIPVVDASVNGKDFLLLPDDPHPNALANRIYAERIRNHLLQFTSERAVIS